jgi:two-component system phosphate regulon sensor histidine kinase PhoR
LVNDLQEITDADRTRGKFIIEEIKLGPFLEDLVKKLMPLYQEKGISLGITMSETINLYSDRKALTKILQNLLYNAYKFTPAGKKVFIGAESIRARAHATNEHDLVEIAVTDEGIGIAAADLSFIFERFYRTDQSRNRESGGFGLGLTIVKELTEALGGKVTVSSQEGKGSRFMVQLPVKIQG